MWSCLAYSKLLVAVVPAAVLIVYIFIRDKYEREPIKKILLAFFVGMVSIPLSLSLIRIFGLDELPYIFEGEIRQQIATAFFSAAIPEEISKFIILFLLIWWNKDFNERMDGIGGRIEGYNGGEIRTFKFVFSKIQNSIFWFQPNVLSLQFVSKMEF